ncbi:MAG TPA: hypothetical protein VE135_16080 [Pyrinomonadaceae bacterium]|nr:hypothetical protein [Pyrinomonadaceae bacterium]
MSVVFVHGVANREDDPSYKPHLKEIKDFLNRYVGNDISPSGTVLEAYWGKFGATFAWNRESRPKSVLFRQGAPTTSSDVDRALVMASVDGSQVPAAPANPQNSSVLVPAGPTVGSVAIGPRIRLKDLSPQELSDLLSTVIVEGNVDPGVRPQLIIAADEVAHDPATPAALAQCTNVQEELEKLRAMLDRKEAGALVGMGPGLWSWIVDRVGEATSRAVSLPAFTLSTVVAETREPINRMVTLFIGDVFAYLKTRKDATSPGPIPQVVMDTLADAKKAAPNEPLIVLTHSMGGQIVYDLVTHFLPKMQSNLRIDFWCATASQVGLFEEMKLFLASTPQYSKGNGNKVPFPDKQYLGLWWNVWDHNDFISYTAAPIIDGIDDESYDSGVSLIKAHGEYLLRPSFYRKFGDKLAAAKKRNWR